MTTVGKLSKGHTHVVYMDVFPEKKGGYSVLCRNWPGLHTCGDTLPQCAAMALESVSLMWELYLERGGIAPGTHARPRPKQAIHTFVFELQA